MLCFVKLQTDLLYASPPSPPTTPLLKLPDSALCFASTSAHYSTVLAMGAPTLPLSAATTPLSSVSSTPRVQVTSATTCARGAPGVRIVCMAAIPRSSGPAINAGDKVASKIEAANEVCVGDNQSEECVAAWGEVEAASKEKAATIDPLDKFCDDNPEADECRVYTD